MKKNYKIAELTSDFLTHEFVVKKVETAGIRCCWDWNTALGDTVKEKYESLYVKLVELTNVMVVKGAKGYFWIVAAPEIGSIFETATAGFFPALCDGNYSQQVPLGVPDIYELGLVNRKWKLFVDPSLDNTTVLIGVGMENEDPKHYGVLKIANMII